MNTKKWLAAWLLIVGIILGTAGFLVYKVDPFFHFRKPDTAHYYYALNNERSQNDGITKHFSYNALITGTSMTENFKTSEMDAIFGTKSIKVPYSGGSYKEINDNLKTALSCNPELKTIVRCLDLGMIVQDKDTMRLDLGTYPTYLYDDNPWNDVKYIFNRDVLWNRTCSMIAATWSDGFEAGITPFDTYAQWQSAYTFGIHTVLPDGLPAQEAADETGLTDEEREMIKGNIEQNVTSLAKSYPDVDFYYFFSPYSIAWWQQMKLEGKLRWQIEAERYAIELILECGNIHLFSFNNRYDMTTDLNNYKDSSHYGMWVNSRMLYWMHDGDYRLTKENYLSYLEDEFAFYDTFDYAKLEKQEDYENDFYADALCREERTGTVPRVVCGENYTETAIEIPDVDAYGYLAIDAKQVAENGSVCMRFYAEDGELLGELGTDGQPCDGEWHQYLVDISEWEGDVRVVFDGKSGDFVYKNITLY